MVIRRHKQKQEKNDELIKRLSAENEALRWQEDRMKKEIEKLSTFISAKNTDCNIGPWCRDCRHYAVDDIDKDCVFLPDSTKYVSSDGMTVRYCKKYLHQLCPEHEMN